MATHSSTDQRGTNHSAATTQRGWYGWFVFAGTIMILLGLFHAMMGLLALFQEEYFVVTQSGLMVEVDYTTWGWTHLILGAVVAISGVGLLAGTAWARVVTVICAFLSSLVNLAFLAANPFWSGIMIAVNILVIYAVIARADDVRDRW